MPDLPERDTYGLDDDPDGLNRLDYLEDLNKIFTLANTYLKPKLVTGPGSSGSTFATTADTCRWSCKEKAQLF